MKFLMALLILLAGGLFLAEQAPENLFAPPDSDKSWAVVVGVSRYQILPKNQWLEFADADADSFSKFLASGQGFRFRPDHILTLENEQATRAAVRSALGAWLVRKIKPGDSVSIFLAAHGVVETEGSKDAYVVAYDTSMENLFDTGLSFPELQDIVQRRVGRAARIFIRLEPRGAYAHNAMGIVHQQQGRYAEALGTFEAAAQRAPRWAYPHFNRALVYLATRQLARAEDAYRRAIQLGPYYAYLHYSLAGLYMQMNQPARAEQEYRRALELDLDAAAGHNMLGNFFRSRERQREAETEYRRALAFHAGDRDRRLVG